MGVSRRTLDELGSDPSSPRRLDAEAGRGGASAWGRPGRVPTQPERIQR